MYQVDYQEYLQKWNLEEIMPLWQTPSSCLYKAVMGKDRQAVVLKFSKCKLKAHFEAMALKFYNGNSAPKIIHYDEERGVILQEQILPGVPLINIFQNRDMDAIRCSVEIIKRQQTQPLKDRSQHQSLLSYLGPLFSPVVFPNVDIEYFREMAHWLISTMKDQVLLHCDLHPHNILLQGKEDWVAIDPRGVIGELAYEAPPLICCYQRPQVTSKVARNEMFRNRLALFAELLQVEKARLQAWMAVYAMRRACTFLKSNKERVGAWLELAQSLRA